jgi:hypothetical protein
MLTATFARVRQLRAALRRWLPRAQRAVLGKCLPKQTFFVDSEPRMGLERK